jgi:transposase
MKSSLQIKKKKKKKKNTIKFRISKDLMSMTYSFNNRRLRWEDKESIKIIIILSFHISEYLFRNMKIVSFLKNQTEQSKCKGNRIE